MTAKLNGPQEMPVPPKGPEQGDPPAGSYLVVAAVVIGVAGGIAVAAATGESYFMIAGLAAGALVAVWLSKRQDP